MNWAQRVSVGVLAIVGSAACRGEGFSASKTDEHEDAGPASGDEEAGTTGSGKKANERREAGSPSDPCEDDRGCDGGSTCNDETCAEPNNGGGKQTEVDAGDANDTPSVVTDDDDPDPGCGIGLGCPQAQVCDPKTGTCVGCIDGSDCATGQVCTAGECIATARCTDSDSCVDTTVCDVASGICVGCLEDADCGEDGECIEQQCRFACQSDAACADQGMVCEVTLGACVQCLTDVDCDADFHCTENHQCTPDRCPIGTSGCLENKTYECDGRDFVLAEACGSEQTCVETDDEASCMDWLCTPGSVECVNGQVETCSDDGLTLSRVNCGATGQSCSGGACVFRACEPGAIRCSGATRYVCAADGLSETPGQCAENEICDPAVGECIFQLCTPNAPVCDANIATTCNALGTGYVDEQLSCPVACSSGECVDALFFEDFEDGDLDGWLSRGGASTMSVTSATAAAGTKYSARIDRNSNHDQGYYRELPDIRPTYVSFWGRSATTELADTYFSLRQSNNAGVLSIYFDNDEGGTFHASNGTTHWTVGSYVANVWYHFEFTIDWDKKTYDLDVDGVRLGTGFGFQNSATSIGQLDIYNYRDSVGHWDEILMR